MAIRDTRGSDRPCAGLRPGWIAAIVAAAPLVLSACAAPAPKSAGECPQPRFTGQAPADYLERKNPLGSGGEAAKAGGRLFESSAGCPACHGIRGDGRGRLAGQFEPPPRNFRCAQTVTGIPDGQLFWIIRFGSPGTAMPAHSQLSDEQVWQLVAHLRQLATN